MRRDNSCIKRFLAIVLLAMVSARLAAEDDGSRQHPSDAVFVRGDVNADGQLTLADTIHTLGYLFQGGDAPSCMAAADANDDEEVDLADVVFSLRALFAGGDPLPAPWPTAGVDPTPGLSCGERDSRRESYTLEVLRPDLTVTNLSITYSSVSGDPYLKFWVKNQGLANAGSFTVKIWDESGAVLRTITLVGLAKGQSTSFSQKVPSRHCGDSATLKIRVDSAYAITESNESNNVKYFVYAYGPC